MRRINFNSDNEKWLPWVIVIGIVLIYWLFLTKNYYWDGIAFAQSIEDATGLNPSLLHPNHLIYNLLGYVFYRALKVFGFNMRAVTALQILNGALGSVCAFILFLILKRVLRSIYYATALTLLFAFSATWWKFATDADSYIVSVLFLLISFSLILPGSKSRPFLVAMSFSVAMLFHQLAVLFFPVAITGLFLQSASKDKKRFLDPLKFSLVAFATTTAAYCSSYYLITGTFDFRRFLQWTTSFSPDVSFSFDFWSNLFYTMRGHWRLFFGGRFNAIAGLVNPFIIVLMLMLAASIAIFIFKLIYQLLRGSVRPGFAWVGLLKTDRRLRTVLLLSAIWILAYLSFLFVFLPHNTFYRLFYLPALILVVGIVLATYQQAYPQPRRYRLALLAVIVTLFNFLFLIYPYSHAQKYPPLALALEMNQVWPRNTIIYYGSANSDNSLVRYFNEGTNWKKLELENSERLEQNLRAAKAEGVNTWLETSAIDQLAASPTGSEWLKQHVKPESQRALITKAHNIRFVQVGPAD